MWSDNETTQDLLGYQVHADLLKKIILNDAMLPISIGVFGNWGSGIYHPEADGGISILDESLGIDWRIPTEHANLSEKDTKHEVLKDFESPFEY